MIVSLTRLAVHHAHATRRSLGNARLRFAVVLAASLLVAGCASTPAGPGQRPDLEYQPPIIEPAFDVGTGPLVLIDEAHFNFHTAEGRYKTFAELLRRDGFVVQPHTGALTERSLATASILVISNALNEDDAEEWVLPNPSAFTAAEIAAVTAWVGRGGSLMLIADHMPFPGAAAELAEAFGLLFINGYARIPDTPGAITFTRADGSLRAHPITDGRNAAERIESVATFGGQAFRVHPDTTAEPLLVMGDGTIMDLPDTASTFTATTPRFSAVGLLQGAVLRHGSGRVAAFGEAAMFSAQVFGEQRFPMGMNAPVASENYQFLLNVVHWLAGRVDAAD
jgi:hypothetical protein